MTSSQRRHLSSSPFQPDPEPTVPSFELGDLVSHDSYGMGRVTSVEAAAVTVDFGAHGAVRITSPYRHMESL